MAEQYMCMGRQIMTEIQRECQIIRSCLTGKCESPDIGTSK